MQRGNRALWGHIADSGRISPQLLLYAPTALLLLACNHLGPSQCEAESSSQRGAESWSQCGELERQAALCGLRGGCTVCFFNSCLVSVSKLAEIGRLVSESSCSYTLTAVTQSQCCSYTLTALQLHSHSSYRVTALSIERHISRGRGTAEAVTEAQTQAQTQALDK